MPAKPDQKMNLSELEKLFKQSPAPLRDLFVKSINLYADPMQNTTTSGQKQDQLRKALESASITPQKS